MSRRRGNNSEDVSVGIPRKVNGNGNELSNHDRDLNSNASAPTKESEVVVNGMNGHSSTTSVSETKTTTTMRSPVGPVVASIFDYTLMVSLVFGGCCTYVLVSCEVEVEVGLMW